MFFVPVVALTAIPIGGGQAFEHFLGMFVGRLGSPLWLAVIATAFDEIIADG